MKKVLFFLATLTLVTSCKKSDSSSDLDSNLNAVFSVSESEEVVFAKSNLQYRASTDTWRFAEYPWDCIGESNENISETYDDWIDLFGWGTGNNPTNSSCYYVDYKSFNDWGDCCGLPTPEGTTGKWRTLTKEEWSYVIFERTTSSAVRFAKAQVNNINGIIIVPDSWTTAIYVLNNTDEIEVDFSVNVISAKDWESNLEPAGCVFLPAAGYRYGVSVHLLNSGGYYWASTPYGSDSFYGCRLRFYPEGCNVLYDDRFYGFPVRLVAVPQN